MGGDRRWGSKSRTWKQGERRKPVADYVLDREDAAPTASSWEEWLQTHRIELNAMTTPQFIEWLDGKMAAYHKLVPPPEVLESELQERIENKVREAITERILREANIDAQVAAALAEIEQPDADTLAEGVEQLFGEKPDAEWRDHIEAVADRTCRRGRVMTGKLSVHVESFKPLKSNTLHGFCDVVIPEMRLRIFDLTVHERRQAMGQLAQQAADHPRGHRAQG